MQGRLQRLYVLVFNSVTVLLVLWELMEFFSKESSRVPLWFVEMYLLALTYYAGDKEFQRWRDRYNARPRHGEYFVFTWVLVTFFVLLFELFANDANLRMPEHLPLITGGAVVIFFMTSYLKMEYLQKRKNHERV